MPRKEVIIMGTNIEAGSNWLIKYFREGSERGGSHKKDLSSPAFLSSDDKREEIWLKHISGNSLIVTTDQVVTTIQGELPINSRFEGQILHQAITDPRVKYTFRLIGFGATIKCLEAGSTDYLSIKNHVELPGKLVSA
jgi:hypothetical protein